ncbi:MAG: hypothetical protein U9Q62_06350, partial [Campylobacterota bacterium]|nr:hypothetical protein [Campylobacterota bacterium]
MMMVRSIALDVAMSMKELNKTPAFTETTNYFVIIGIDKFADSVIEFIDIEKGMITQPHQNPALDTFDTQFDFTLVLRF